MSELDLDVLERRCIEAQRRDFMAKDGQAAISVKTRQFLALIQRLREAEAQLAGIRSKWDYGDRLIHRNERLERVREAAEAAINDRNLAWQRWAVFDDLRAALAAVEEPAKA